MFSWWLFVCLWFKLSVCGLHSYQRELLGSRAGPASQFPSLAHRSGRGLALLAGASQFTPLPASRTCILISFLAIEPDRAHQASLASLPEVNQSCAQDKIRALRNANLQQACFDRRLRCSTLQLPPLVSLTVVTVFVCHMSS